MNYFILRIVMWELRVKFTDSSLENIREEFKDTAPQRP
jgi:hypothetical protein